MLSEYMAQHNGRILERLLSNGFEGYLENEFLQASTEEGNMAF
jgi:hypothetical protein